MAVEPIEALDVVYGELEEAGYRYVIRLKANAVLEREIEHLLKRPVGRPSRKPKVFYHSFQYQAKSWDQPRRVVAKVGRNMKRFWRERRGRYGLRAKNRAQATSTEGPLSIEIARGIPFWTGNRRARWKVTSRFVNMGRLLLLGTYPSGAYMGNPG